ncbi:MAG: hypothetical protein ACYCOU_19775, partial [Sulfobacillus sp.]
VRKDEIEYELDPDRCSNDVQQIGVHTLDTIKTVWTTGSDVLSAVDIERMVKSFNIKPMTIEGNARNQIIVNYTI